MPYLVKYIFVALTVVAFASCAGQDSATSRPHDGTFKSNYPDGTLELEVSYKGGTRAIRYFYPSGKLHTEVDTAGNYHQYFEDGTLAMEFTEKDGKKIGEEKIYYSNGKLNSVLKYDDGVCYHRDAYYGDGVLMSACDIVRQPKRREICQSFYKSGKPQRVTDADGHYTLFHENGVVKQDFLYRGDTLVEKREFYATGSPKNITRYNGIQIKECGLCNLQEDLTYYADGVVKDSCYTVKPPDWDGETRRGVVKACKQFYEDGALKSEPIYRNGELSETKMYYPSGKLKEHKVYQGAGGEQKVVSETRYNAEGLVSHSCFMSVVNRKVCNRFGSEGQPVMLYSERDGKLEEKTFFANGNVKSVQIDSSIGKLSYTLYDMEGAVLRSCTTLHRGEKSYDVCNTYGKDGSPQELRTVKGDTIFEQRFFKEKLLTQCAILWYGDSSAQYCKSFRPDGALRDSTVEVRQKGYYSRHGYTCDEKGNFIHYVEDVVIQKGDLYIEDAKYCKVVEGEIVDCKEEHFRRGEE